jgi:hypothetical protein
MANVWDKSYYNKVIVPKGKAHYVTRTKKGRKYLYFLDLVETVLVCGIIGVLLLIALM